MRLAVPDLEMIARLYLQNLEVAARGDPGAGERLEWMTIELVDQLAREQPGGEMLKFWKLQPMPAEEFVLQRMGREVLRFLEYFRSLPSDQQAACGQAQPADDPLAIGKFRLSGEVHKWMYDRVSLRLLLSRCGFTDIQVKTADRSSIPNFSSSGLDLAPDGSVRKPDSLFMEASK